MDTTRSEVNTTREAVVADPEGRVLAVTIIRPGPSRHEPPLHYPAEVLAASVPLWNGAAAFADHFNKSVRNLVGVYFDPYWDAEDPGLKAKLRVVDEGLFRVMHQLIADRDAGLPVPDLGISAEIAVELRENEDGSHEATRIVKVISADVVFQPAAGGSLDRILNSLGLEQGRASAAGAESRDARTEKRLRDLQGTADRLRNQMGQLETALGEEKGKVADLEARLEQAVGKYREALLAADPTLPPELLAGESVDELERSAALARRVVEQVRGRLVEEGAQTLVPAGAPGRTLPDLSGLSPREKIKMGLARP